MRSLRCRLGFESQHSLKAVRVAVWRKTYINWDEKWQLRRIWSRINTDHSCFVSKRLPIPPKPHVLIGWKSRRHLDLLAANFAVFQKIFSIRRSLNFGDLLLGGSFFFQAENNVLLPSTRSLPGPSFEFLIAPFFCRMNELLVPLRTLNGIWLQKTELFKLFLYKGRGCGAVDGAVALTTRDPRFESQYRQKNINWSVKYYLLGGWDWPIKNI